MFLAPIEQSRSWEILMKAKSVEIRASFFFSISIVIKGNYHMGPHVTTLTSFGFAGAFGAILSITSDSAFCTAPCMVFNLAGDLTPARSALPLGLPETSA
jgi:hypothetical protein